MAANAVAMLKNRAIVNATSLEEALLDWVEVEQQVQEGQQAYLYDQLPEPKDQALAALNRWGSVVPGYGDI